MSIQYRIKALMSDKSELISDSVYVTEIQQSLPEEFGEMTELDTVHMCLKEVRGIFDEIGKGDRKYLTLLINESEISIMCKSLSVVAVEVCGEKGNPLNAPENWAIVFGIDAKAKKKAQQKGE